MLTLHLRSLASELGLATGHGDIQWPVVAGWVGLVWYTTVTLVCSLGTYQIWKHCLQRPQKSTTSSSARSNNTPHITAIRPVKGLEPHLYECLASTFRQDYPRDKLTVYFCISTKTDPAYPTLQKLVSDFPHADARIFVEDDDPLLHSEDGGGHASAAAAAAPPAYELGPNPKIRNMSRAYREAKGDIVWIIDCNVWVGKGVCGRMMDKLCGTAGGKRYKFVHHLPVAVDVTGEEGLKTRRGEQEALLESYTNGWDDGDDDAAGAAAAAGPLTTGGGRLEELFLSSSHAKMYTAINTVLIAPCIVGKSNMFRRSHLDYLTAAAPSTTAAAADRRRRNPGIDYFSDNICEDHLIGDLLWKSPVREEKELGQRWGKHAMVFGDLAFQPVAHMSVQSYVARRVRWLRVRKFTVLLATLVEPGTESILCSCYGAWGVTTALAQFLGRKGYAAAEAALSTWPAFWACFALSMLGWILTDWLVYIMLHSGRTVELDEDTPSFARPPPQGTVTRRPFLHWLAAWLGREVLALPIWIWAFYGGVTVTWRDRRFRVGLDMRVREIVDGDATTSTIPGLSSSRSSPSGASQDRNKTRRD
ncbi:putative ceramide glucosyltransferase [Aspergillus fijiensis CBS 313.89]|uniref:Ceramide glucosyltransferase n=1 Tax=Aspergillus fijiensis CBS 313.89 TaxID=1448319 RepID=A0A8G1S072_9EURO|nr:uncharacterized protein BO72DRAFT_444996 [Aspergillus fijiensis CBS 313.89]RAK80995.1 hypothetical protein BO72DRAFT_444996 [Aspergillus fijiensis CBS 313.89]